MQLHIDEVRILQWSHYFCAGSGKPSLNDPSSLKAASSAERHPDMPASAPCHRSSPHLSSSIHHHQQTAMNLKPSVSITPEPASKHLAAPTPSTADRGSCKQYDNSAVFKWPGIETLMEAYQRHMDGMSCCYMSCSRAFFNNIYKREGLDGDSIIGRLRVSRLVSYPRKSIDDP